MQTDIIKNVMRQMGWSENTLVKDTINKKTVPVENWLRVKKSCIEDVTRELYLNHFRENDTPSEDEMSTELLSYAKEAVIA